MSKKLHWLKLAPGFFTQKSIKKLRSIAGGDTYTVIYQKMLLKSLETEGILYYEGFEDSFEKELALDIDEDTANVEMTVSFLLHHKLLIESGENEYSLPETFVMAGKESSSSDRVRKFRQRKKLEEIEEPAEDETLNETLHVTKSNTEKRREEKEKEKEKREKLKPFLPLSSKLYYEHFKHDDKFLQGKNLDDVFYRWADDIRLLIERDGREWSDVEKVIKWCQSPGCFWVPNILSGKKLREKFPVLWGQMSNKQNKGRVANPQGSEDYFKQNGDGF